MIGNDIEVTIVDIRGGKVLLGITAPRSISVHRKEVFEAIRREKHAAAKPGAIETANGPVEIQQLRPDAYVPGGGGK